MRKILLTILIAGISFVAYAQDSSVHSAMPFNSFDKHSSILGISFGISDWNKQNFKIPDSSKFGSGSMSLPVYFRAERAVHKHISLAISLAYDVFYYSYSKEGYGNGNLFYRQQTDKVRIISPGIEAYYHFDKFISSRNLDVFVGVGARANYVKHTNYPTTDTLSNTTKPDMSPFLKLGARYYINRNAAIFGDIGYDKISFISLGFSYRLYGRVLSL